MSITADLEAGTNGNTIATSDAGSATAWNVVTIGTGATLKYDNVQKAHGSLSAKIVHGGTSTASFLEWSTALGTQTDHYGRVYVYWPGGSPAGVVLMIYNRLSGGGCWRIQVNTSGKFEIANNSAVVVATSTTSVPASAGWVRLEFHAVHSNSVGSVTLSIYKTNPDAAIGSFDEQVTTGSIDTMSSSNEILFGVILNMASFTLQLDDIAAGGATWFGPTTSAGPRAIAGAINATSAISGAVVAHRAISAAISATSAISGSVPVRRAITAALTASSAISGTVVVQRAVAAAITATSAIGAVITTGATTVQRSGSTALMFILKARKRGPFNVQ